MISLLLGLVTQSAGRIVLDVAETLLAASRDGLLDLLESMAKDHLMHKLFETTRIVFLGSEWFKIFSLLAC